MYLHGNAKLGLAGRLALVRAVEGGLSLSGGIVGSGRARKLGGRCRVRLIARAGRTARRGSWQPSWRSGSAPAAGKPAGIRAWSRVRPLGPRNWLRPHRSELMCGSFLVMRRRGIVVGSKLPRRRCFRRKIVDAPARCGQRRSPSSALYAASSYSWIRPPSRSRRRTRH
jgi:hypothetical protein